MNARKIVVGHKILIFCFSDIFKIKYTGRKRAMSYTAYEDKYPILKLKKEYSTLLSQASKRQAVEIINGKLNDLLVWDDQKRQGWANEFVTEFKNMIYTSNSGNMQKQIDQFLKTKNDVLDKGLEEQKNAELEAEQLRMQELKDKQDAEKRAADEMPHRYQSYMSIEQGKIPLKEGDTINNSAGGTVLVDKKLLNKIREIENSQGAYSQEAKNEIEREIDARLSVEQKRTLEATSRVYNSYEATLNEEYPLKINDQIINSNNEYVIINDEILRRLSEIKDATNEDPAAAITKGQEIIDSVPSVDKAAAADLRYEHNNEKLRYYNSYEEYTQEGHDLTGKLYDLKTNDVIKRSNGQYIVLNDEIIKGIHKIEQESKSGHEKQQNVQNYIDAQIITDKNRHVPQEYQSYNDVVNRGATLHVGDTVGNYRGEHVRVDEELYNKLNIIYAGTGDMDSKSKAFQNAINASITTEELKKTAALCQKLRDNGVHESNINKLLRDFEVFSNNAMDANSAHNGRHSLFTLWEQCAEQLKNAKSDEEKGSIVSGLLTATHNMSIDCIKIDNKNNIDEKGILYCALSGERKTIINDALSIGQSVTMFPHDPGAALLNTAASILKLSISLSEYAYARNMQERLLEEKKNVLEKQSEKDTEALMEDFRLNNPMVSDVQQEVNKNLQEIYKNLSATKKIENHEIGGTLSKETRGGIETGRLRIEFNEFAYTGTVEDVGRLCIAKRVTETTLEAFCEEAKIAGEDKFVSLAKDNGFTEGMTLMADKNGQISLLGASGEKLATGTQVCANKMISKIDDTEKGMKQIQNVLEKANIAVQSGIKTAAASIVVGTNPYMAAAKVIIDSLKKTINKVKEQRDRFSKVEDER